MDSELLPEASQIHWRVFFRIFLNLSKRSKNKDVIYHLGIQMFNFTKKQNEEEVMSILKNIHTRSAILLLLITPLSGIAQETPNGGKPYNPQSRPFRDSPLHSVQLQGEPAEVGFVFWVWWKKYFGWKNLARFCNRWKHLGRAPGGAEFFSRKCFRPGMIY